MIVEQLTIIIQLGTLCPSNLGPCGEIRTPDPLVPNQMRYQTALHTDELAPRLGLEPRTIRLTVERSTN